MNIKTIVLERNRLGVAFFEYRLVDLTTSKLLARCDAMSGSEIRAKKWGDLMAWKLAKATKESI